MDKPRDGIVLYLTSAGLGRGVKAWEYPSLKQGKVAVSVTFDLDHCLTLFGLLPANMATSSDGPWRKEQERIDTNKWIEEEINRWIEREREREGGVYVNIK